MRWLHPRLSIFQWAASGIIHTAPREPAVEGSRRVGGDRWRPNRNLSDPIARWLEHYRTNPSRAVRCPARFPSPFAGRRSGTSSPDLSGRIRELEGMSVAILRAGPLTTVQ